MSALKFYWRSECGTLHDASHLMDTFVVPKAQQLMFQKYMNAHLEIRRFN